MGLIMNGNCLRVSSYFGRNRIFAVYYVWWIRLSLWRMCWNCYYVCYCIVWMLVSLSHIRYIAAAREWSCCHCYFTHIIIIIVRILLSFLDSQSTLWCTTSYMNYIASICVICIIWISPFIHTLQCIRKRTLLHRILCFCCYFFSSSSVIFPFFRMLLCLPFEMMNSKRNEMMWNEDCDEYRPFFMAFVCV